ncbi:hypothetical protein AOLI_G00078720 [Acnodon oligacanthus]
MLTDRMTVCEHRQRAVLLSGLETLILKSGLLPTGARARHSAICPERQTLFQPHLNPTLSGNLPATQRRFMVSLPILLSALRPRVRRLSAAPCTCCVVRRWSSSAPRCGAEAQRRMRRSTIFSQSQGDPHGRTAAVLPGLRGADSLRRWARNSVFTRGNKVTEINMMCMEAESDL